MAERPLRRDLPPESLSAAFAIEVAPIPRSARTTIWLIVAALFSGLAWAQWAEMDEIVVAPGKLATIEPPDVLQPLETATIKRMDGQIGDVVRKGQVLVELDQSFTGADVVASRTELESLDALIARLKAELNGLTAIPNDARVADDKLHFERELLADRLRENAARLAVFAAREQKALVEIAATEELRPRTERRRDGYAKLFDARKAAFGEVGGARNQQVLEPEVQLLAAEQEMVQLAVKIKSLEGELRGIAAEREAYLKERRRQVAEQLGEAERQQARVAGGLRKSERRDVLSDLRAPADAIIFERAKLNAGSVAQSGNPLFVLVRLGTPLEVEVEIPARDIGLVRLEALVSVKLEAFPFQNFDMIAGRVKSIAPDVTIKPASEGGAATFKAKIELRDQRLKKMPAEQRLSAGMTATAEIKSGKRTVLSYLIYPIIRWFSEGGKEPSPRASSSGG